MSSSRPVVPLAELCEAIVDCEHKTAPLVEHGHPSIRTTDIKNGRIDFDGANRVSEQTYRYWTQRLEPEPGDLILAREAPVGEIGIIPEGVRPCLGQRTVLLRPDRSRVVPRYLMYTLASPGMRHALMSRAEGCTVPHLNVADIRQIPIPEPPALPEQQRIADILGALDDKIELNRRMNRTLESIARAIFKSWFVDFDPVRKKMEGGDPGLPPSLAALFPDSLEDSPIGPIPRGWPVVSLSDLADVNPKYTLPRGAEATYVEMASLPTDAARVVDWRSRPFQSGSRFQNGDVLVARITPCLENGKTALVDFLTPGATGWGSTEFLVLRARPPVSPEYVYCLSRSDAFRDHAVGSMTGSSGRQRVPAEALEKFMTLRPDADALAAFSRWTHDAVKRMASNDGESRCLGDLRDGLLPRLLSGDRLG